MTNGKRSLWPTATSSDSKTSARSTANRQTNWKSHPGSTLLDAARSVCPPAVSRRGNPQTSFEAEEAINKDGSRATHASVVLGIIQSEPGLTTGEVGDTSGLGQMETRKRISDLKNMGMIFAGDVRVWKPSGRKQSTWWPISKDGVQEALL